MNYELYFEEDEKNLDYLNIIPYLEAKLKTDYITYQHSLNVANLSIKLLKKSTLHINESLVYYAGLFHDIGKTIIPLKILEKQMPLSTIEYKQIKEHSKQGFRILQHYNFPMEVMFAALLHHEQYDGSGYPIGYTGKEIPVVARIIHICDVFDALTSDRPYRKALSVNEAIKIMENSCGTYDPELYSLFASSCI